MACEQCQCNHWLQYTREYMYLFKTLYYSLFCHSESYHPVQIASKVLYMVFKDKNISFHISREGCVLFSWPSWRLLACLIIYILFLWEKRHWNEINKNIYIYIWLIQSGTTASSLYTKGCMVQYNEKYKTLTAI